mmetsp:Transcript_21322/g.30174  ORF Transcript_21322/g.30174 Transcript_21322/m.30174 type:complete len:98 (+) Transcript_21322:26-319(+)
MQIKHPSVPSINSASDFASWATNAFKETTEAMLGSFDIVDYNSSSSSTVTDETLEEIGYAIGVDGILIGDEEDTSGLSMTTTRSRTASHKPNKNKND